MYSLNVIEFTAEAITKWAMSTGLKLLFAILILFVGWWAIRLLAKLIRKMLAKSRIDPGASGFIVSVLKVFLWLVVILISLAQLDINLNSMIAALGAAGLTASFALQGSLGNFVSGMQVIFSKPFGIGDFLSVDVHMGTVKAITVLNTTLVTPDNKEIIIPNSMMTSGIVVNFTSQDTRRLDLSYRVAYSTDTALPKEILNDLIASNPAFLQDPPPIVAVGAHNPDSLEIVAKVWVKAEAYWDIYYFMQEQVKIAFEAKGLSFPAPKLEVAVATPSNPTEKEDTHGL